MKTSKKKGRAARVPRSKPAARELPPDVQRYLATLRRIPVEVRQSMATREFDMGYHLTCVCGWAIREAVMATLGTDYCGNSEYGCVEEFGGTVQEWSAIFGGVCYVAKLPAIEEAFTIAVAETVR